MWLSNFNDVKDRRAVLDFLEAFPNEQRRGEGYQLLELFEKITQNSPRLYPDGFIGFAQNGRACKNAKSSFVFGFAPKIDGLVIRVSADLGSCENILSGLGEFSRDASCIYIDTLTDIEVGVMENILKQTYLSERNTS